MKLFVYMCTLPCTYILIAVAHSLLVKGYRARVCTERNIVSVFNITYNHQAHKKMGFVLGGAPLPAHTVPVLKAGHPGVPSYYMFVCLGYGWVGYFTFLFFLIYLS